MDKKEDYLSNFKTAIISTVRSLSNKENVNVVFGKNKVDDNKTTINLPDLESLNKKNFIKTRAQADSSALKLKYSDNKTFRKFLPEGSTSKILYEIAEKIRYEKLGSHEFKGVKNNLVGTRYHSLIIDKKTLNKDFIITAKTKDNVIMGIMHKNYNVHGVQFHPESISTKEGMKLIKNFLKYK